MDNLVDTGDTKYYELFLCSTGQVVAVPVDYSVGVVNGILQRVVNKDAELINWFFSDPLIS